MEIILAIATFLGGITAIWFFWDKFQKKNTISAPNYQNNRNEKVSDQSNMPEELAKAENDDVELGYLDYIVDIHSGFETLTNCIKNISEILMKITKQSSNITKVVNRLGVKMSHKSTMKIRNLLRIEGIRLRKYSDEMKIINSNYMIQLSDLSESIENVILSEVSVSAGATEGLHEFLAALNLIEENSGSTMNTFKTLQDIVDRLPNMEKTYNSARKFLSREISKFIDNIDHTAKMIEKVRPHILNILNN